MGPGYALLRNSYDLFGYGLINDRKDSSKITWIYLVVWLFTYLGLTNVIPDAHYCLGRMMFNLSLILMYMQYTYNILALIGNVNLVPFITCVRLLVLKIIPR